MTLFLGHQQHAAMLADIVESADLVVVTHHAKDGLVAHRRRQIVAWLLDLRLDAGDLPRLGPDVIPFLLPELPRPVTLRCDRLVAEYRGGRLRNVGEALAPGGQFAAGAGMQGVGHGTRIRIV